MESELEVEVVTRDMEGQGTVHVLTINKPFEHGYKLILGDTQRAKLAQALLDSLIPLLPMDDRAGPASKEGSIANLLALGGDGCTEFQTWVAEQYRLQAKARANRAAADAGAKDKDQARDLINRALGRKEGDRSILSPEEYERAAQTLKEMGEKPE